jgi:hypothetical protein
MLIKNKFFFLKIFVGFFLIYEIYILGFFIYFLIVYFKINFMEIFHKILKGFFILSLIFLSLKNYSDIAINEQYFNWNITFYSNNFKIPFILQIKEYSIVILMLQNYLLILSALFIIMDFTISFLSFFLFFIIDIILIHNPISSENELNYLIIFEYLSLLGGIVNI